MVFYLIGLGLGDPTDITARALQVVKNCERVYLEGYTSILSAGKEALEAYYGREVKLADREQVEQGSDDLFEGAIENDVAFLVVGDPFSATTHTDLALRAHNLSIPFQVISNASIITAVGCSGLQLHKFGETVSIPFWQDGWEPESFIDKINRNLYHNLHTLCLLDIKVKEQSLENYLKGKKIYEPPRFLRVHQAAQQLLTIVNRRMASAEKRTSSKESSSSPELEDEKELFVGLTEDSVCVAAVRIGTETQALAKATLKEMSELDLGGPLHSLVICATLHSTEEEALHNLIQSNNDEDKNLTTKKQFSLVGLGLGQPSDITMKGLERVKNADKVYLDGLTSVMDEGNEAFRKFFNKNLIIADRELLEKNMDKIFDSNGNIVFLVTGDPLSTSTHVDLVSRALKNDFRIDIVHNASILNAAGCCGLQLYSFGQTVSIPFWRNNWKPENFYDKICQNVTNGWHTLCLLDRKLQEGSKEKLSNDKESQIYLTADQASAQLVQIIKERESYGQPIPLDCGHKVIALARIGTKDQILKTTSLEEMVDTDLGDPLHSLIIVGETHPLEDEYISLFHG